MQSIESLNEILSNFKGKHLIFYSLGTTGRNAPLYQGPGANKETFLFVFNCYERACLFG